MVHPAHTSRAGQLVPLLSGTVRDWRTSFLIEYYGESAIPWLVGMTYKAVRTARYKLIRWVHHDDCDELYDLEQDPYELQNRLGDPASTRRYATSCITSW